MIGSSKAIWRSQMKAKSYWFPVRPARDGWGWGLPVVWQGWLAFALFLAALIAGMVALLPFGQLAVIAYSCAVGGLFLGVVFWKGEPQSERDRASP
jgi:hypothetical protein